jgi:hypothetical protein
MEKFNFKELLFLNKMILPSIITLIYWVVSAVVTILLLVSGLNIIMLGQTLAGLLIILLGIPLGILSVRLYCEILVVIFKINNNLQKIVDKN